MTLPHDPDCIFCKIVARQEPAAIIHEDEHIIAFLNAFPAAEGHSLIVPKAHYPDILPMPPQELQAVILFAQRLAHAQMAAVAADGIGMAQFNRAAAGQTVFHYHMHAVPRWKGKSMNFHGRQRADMDDLLATAERLRMALNTD